MSIKSQIKRKSGETQEVSKARVQVEVHYASIAVEKVLKVSMSFSQQSSFGDRASSHNGSEIDESALKAVSQRFDIELITRLSLNQNLAFVPQSLALCINLTELDLSSNALTKLGSELGGLRELKRLNLNSNKLTTIEGLCHRNAYISDDEGRPRTGLRKLSHLSLCGNMISSLDGLRLDELASNLPSLRSLYLQNIDRSLLNAVCKKNGYKEAVLARLPGLSNLDGERSPSTSSYHQMATQVEALVANPHPPVELVLPSPSPWIPESKPALDPVERSAEEIEYEAKVKKVTKGIDEAHALFEVIQSLIMTQSKSKIATGSAATN